MEEDYIVYYCSVCNVCKKPAESTASMKFCSGCKLIQYCSIEHQKRDWPEHKEFCKCVQHVLQKMEVEHVYQLKRPLSSPDDIVCWNTMKNSVAKLLELTLKRRLNTIEMQMVLHPPVCSYCHIYKINQMFICQTCKSVLYCSEEHQSKDQKHLSVCKLYHQSFEIDMLRFHRRLRMFDFIGFANQCRVKKLVGNMETFIKSLTSSLTTKGICLSEPLSFSLTLVYVISKLAKISTNQLTIHIVGADPMELLAMQTFPLIYHLLPHIIHLKIILIGPRVADEDDIPLCIEASNISLSSVRTLYHNYVVDPKFVTPDIIAVFNCGFCEFVKCPQKDMWIKSLTCILSFRNSIVAVTSYTKSESEEDTERLLSFKPKGLHCNPIVKCKINPFASLYPHRDWESAGVYFVNGYITVFKM